MNWKLRNLWRSIGTAHRLRNGHLDVKQQGRFWYWCRDRDPLWVNYQNARIVIGQYPRLETVLNWLHWI